MTDTPNDGLKRNGLTYSDAGVDIDAGNLMVEKIKPHVRSTRRPGADTEIGGFGGLFDLKAAGFLEGAVPPGFRVPTPNASDALMPDEDPLTELDFQDYEPLPPEE